MRPIKLQMDFIIDDVDKFWYINRQSDGLFYVEKESSVVHYIKQLPGESKFRLYNSGVMYKKKLFFFPFYADHILVYHIDTGEFEQIRHEVFQKENNQYSISFVFKNIAIAISTYGKRKIIYFDLEKETVKESELNQIERGTFSRDYVIKDDSLYLTMTDVSVIYEIDLINADVKKYMLDVQSLGFGTIAQYGKYFILSGNDGVYMWNIGTNEVNRYNNFPDGYGFQTFDGIHIDFSSDINSASLKYGQPFWRSVVMGNEICFISAVANMSLVFNLESKQISKLDLGELETDETLRAFPMKDRQSALKHVSVSKSINSIIVSNTRECSVTIIQGKDNQKKIIEGKISEADICKYLINNKFREEDLSIDLQVWLKYLEGDN